MPRHILVIHATVSDATDREPFDVWYSREHLPDAAKSFDCKRAWRFWSGINPSQHSAMYEFDDCEALARATAGEEMKRLIRDFDRDWPGVKRTRDILVQSDEFSS